jgi:hypothetical protein
LKYANLRGVQGLEPHYYPFLKKAGAILE